MSFLLVYNTLSAGAQNDYEVCVGKCERRLEDASHKHTLGDPIYFETANGSTRSANDTVENKTDKKEVSSPSATDDEKQDQRIEKIRRFFKKYNSPAAKHAELFVEVADQYNLDWYLLPSIAFIESGGGKACRYNNIFGWNSGKKKFRSVEEGIRYVAEALTTGPYKDKNTQQKLRVYNKYAHYQVVAVKVMRGMQLI